MTEQSADAATTNRAHWDELADLHAGLGGDGRRNSYYDIEGLVAGRSSLLQAEQDGLESAVGEVDGLRVLHAQCHIGLDAITLARAGARVTGVDFSSVALSHAAEIGRRCGVDIDWVRADITSPPRRLVGRFDLVYATFGILCWIEDPETWMRSVHSMLAPGGRLLLVDIHPLYLMVDRVEPFGVDFPYRYDGPRTFSSDGSYAAGDAEVTAKGTIEFAHSLGEVVTAAVAAGLVVERLDEQFSVELDPRGDLLTQDPDGWFRLRVDQEVLPVTYSLIARRDDAD